MTSKVRWESLFSISLVVGTLLCFSVVRAENRPSETTARVPAASPSASSASSEQLERGQRRLYPGGMDEQDLKVQSSLPQPSRTFDGSAVPGEVAPAPDDD